MDIGGSLVLLLFRFNAEGSTTKVERWVTSHNSLIDILLSLVVVYYYMRIKLMLLPSHQKRLAQLVFEQQSS